VERGSKEAIFAGAKHPYTKALLSATPQADPKAKKERIKLVGELPSPLAVPDGCPFAPRCWKAQEKCRIERPGLGAEAHSAACFFPEN
jgi:dipeptide transport system ATP-binding protein